MGLEVERGVVLGKHLHDNFYTISAYTQSERERIYTSVWRVWWPTNLWVDLATFKNLVLPRLYGERREMRLRAAA